MKILLRSLFVVMFAIMCVGFDYNQWSYTQEDPAPVWNTETVKFTFDDTYTAQGVDLLIGEVKVVDQDGTEVFLIEKDLSKTPPEDGMFVVPCRDYWETVPNGLYGAQARVFDVNGNASDWSPMQWFRKEWVSVPAPGGCYLLR